MLSEDDGDSDLDDFDRDPSPMSLKQSTLERKEQEAKNNNNENNDNNNNNNYNDILPNSIPDLRIRHKSMMEARDYIEKELLTTEETYIEGLRVLLFEFYDKIFSEKLIKQKHRPALESNLAEIYKFHTQFLESLKKGPSIPKVFNQQADFLKMYTVYVNQYDSIMNKFSSFRNNKKLQAFLRAKRKQKKPLTNHLILPIQRVPRYTLLLTDLKKHTPQEHSEYTDLCSALSKIDKISHVINEHKRQIENMSQCLQVQENLKDLKDSIVEAHRKFLKQYYFFRKRKARQFFVFNDILIIADDKWRVKEIIEMRSIAVRRDTNENTVFTVYGTNKPRDYNTEVLEDIDEFMKVIEKYRAKVWEGDVSRLSKHGGHTLKALLQEQGVSQAQQYRQQVNDLKKSQNATFGLNLAASQFSLVILVILVVVCLFSCSFFFFFFFFFCFLLLCFFWCTRFYIILLLLFLFCFVDCVVIDVAATAQNANANANDNENENEEEETAKK